ncbi:MAG: hypothetical protein GX678_08310 [Actinomycetales bacterium]|nr:hypothetical protein [Actinomycetales bacterium]
MRNLFIAAGVLSIVAYAVVGAFMMNLWAVEAASEVPLATAIADMKAAGQFYTPVGGYVFATVGITLALMWAFMVIKAGAILPAWAAVMLWAGILTLGAVSYFFNSFGNLNSVGDTYADWNADAAWALERPLYLISLAALGVTIAAPLVAFSTSLVRKRSAA